MTQILNPTTGPLAVLVAGSSALASGVTLHAYPMTSVAEAREEFPDVAEFADDVRCQGCGLDARAARENTCDSCGAPGCDCEVTAAAHGMGQLCNACHPFCNCADCEA